MTVALVAGAFAFVFLQREGRGRPSMPKGDVTERLRLPTIGGSTFDPRTLHGKKVLVSFWSPSCGVCAEKLPELQTLADGRDDTELVAVAIKGREKRVARAARKRGLHAPVLLDRGARLIKSFGGDRVPWTLILDRTGRARRLLVGGHERSAYDRALDEI